MIWMIVSLLVAVYGVWYAVNPLPYLQRRMKRKDIPEHSVKTARIVGIVLAVLGVAVAVFQAVGLGLLGEV